MAVSVADKVTGWAIGRLAYARKQWAREIPAALRQPARLAADFITREGAQSRYGVESSDTDAMYRLAATSAWAYSDIQLIANRVSARAARIKVGKWEKGEVHTEPKHPLTDLLANPNPLMSGAFLLRYTAWWLLLSGNAYVFVSTPSIGRGEPSELWPLVANKVAPQPDTLREGPLGLTIDYEYEVHGQRVLLPGEHVIHFRTANPWDYWRGLAPLAAGILAVETDHNQGQWNSQFFGKDNAIPLAVISLPETISDVDFDRAKDEIKEEFGGQRKTAITRAGDLSIETIQQSIADMQLIESRDFSRQEIDRVYGVPEGLISGGLSGDSRLAAETAFAVNTIQPLIDYMAEEWTVGLAWFYDRSLICVAPDIVPRDRALTVQEYSIFGQDRTINENREELGLEPLKHPLCQEIPVRLLQFVAPTYPTMDGSEPEPPPAPVVVQAAPEPEAAPEAEEPPQAGAMSGQDAPQNVAAEEGAKAVPHVPGQLVSLSAAELMGCATELKRWRTVALKEVKAGRLPTERPFVSDILPPGMYAGVLAKLALAEDEAGVKAVFATALEPATRKALADAEVGANQDPFAAARARAEARLQAAFQQAHTDAGQLRLLAEGVDPAALFSEQWMAEYEARLNAKLPPVIRSIASDIARQLASNIGVSWQLVNLPALQLADRHMYELVSGLTDTTRRQLQETIGNWIASGEPLTELTAQLTTIFDSPVRAEMIAATEVTRVYQQANEAAWRAANERLNAGIIGAQWRTAVDDRRCEQCLAMDGSFRMLDGAYENGVIMPLHPRCRCWEVPTLSIPGSGQQGPGPREGVANG